MDAITKLRAQYAVECDHTNRSILDGQISDTIIVALSLATDDQIKSEWARRTQAMRKVKTGGRNGGRKPLVNNTSRGS